MIGIVTAQELRANLGDVSVSGRTCTRVDRLQHRGDRARFHEARTRGAAWRWLAPNGEVIDHHDGRTLNPGHAIECAWFIMHEGKLRGDRRLIRTGLHDPGLDVAARLGRGIRRAVLFPRSARPAGAGILARHEVLVAAQRGDHRHAAGLAADRRPPSMPAGISWSTTGASRIFPIRSSASGTATSTATAPSLHAPRAPCAKARSICRGCCGIAGSCWSNDGRSQGPMHVRRLQGNSAPEKWKQR